MLEEFTRDLPPQDFSTCDPQDLVSQKLFRLSDFLVAAARTDLPPEVQMVLSTRTSEVTLIDRIDAGASSELRMVMTMLENPSWTALPLAEVARLLAHTWSNAAGFIGMDPFLTHPWVTDRAVIAAIYTLTVESPFFLKRHARHTGAALERLGSFSPPARVAVVLGTMVHDHLAFSSRRQRSDALVDSLPLGVFASRVQETWSGLGSPEAVEIWRGLHGDFAGPPAELVSLSRLLAASQT